MAGARAIRHCTLVVAAAMVLGVPRLLEGQSANDAFDPGANGAVNAIVVQPDGKIIFGGAFTMLGGGGTGATPRHRIGRLNVDGSIDPSFDPGADGELRALALQPDGKILVAGAFTALGGGSGTIPRYFLGRLHPDGSLDHSFNPGANAPVNAIAVQPDGRIILGGQFTSIGGGGAGAIPRHHIARVNADGSVDPAFDPGADGHVGALALDAQRRIVVGGRFTRLGGGGGGITARPYLGRLHSDGTLDTGFVPILDGDVWALAVLVNDQIVAGGSFTMARPSQRTHARIARFNADGSVDDGMDIWTNDTVYALAVQPDGRVVIGGAFTSFHEFGTSVAVPAGHLLRHERAGGNAYDHSLAPVDGTVFALAALPDGRIVAGGAFANAGGGATPAATRNRIARFNQDGSLETNFDPGANDTLWAIAIQADSRIVVGGSFTFLGGGGAGQYVSRHIGGLTIDGSADASFTTAADGPVRALAVQPDGKIVVGGHYSLLGVPAAPRNEIGRVSTNGLLDQEFNAGMPQGGAADQGVRAAVIQPDGRIVLGGNFHLPAWRKVLRLAADGVIEDDFTSHGRGVVYDIARQPDGKLVVVGEFTTLGGGTPGETPRNYIARLNADGTIDESFNPGADDVVMAVALQADGKILIGGGFGAVGGGVGVIPRQRLARLHADGSVDESFNPAANDHVYALALQADGKIIVGGRFTALRDGDYGSLPRSHIGRLNADGSVDVAFDPGANGDVRVITVQRDGRILVGGDFTMLGEGGTGTAVRHHIGRLTNPDAVQEQLAIAADGTGVTWRRQGGGPEFGRVTFELSFTGMANSFAMLGSGSRIPGGWRLEGQQLPPQQAVYIRARGYDASESIAQSVWRVMASCAPITLSTTVFATAQVGVAYSPVAVTPSGGDGVTTFSITEGALAPGLSISSDGIVSGIPVATGTFNFTISAVTENGCAGSRGYTMTVTATAPFSDDPIVSTVTLVRALHVGELRTRIDALRVVYGLLPFSWSDPAVSAGMPVKAVHLRELRGALQQAYEAAGEPPPMYTDADLIAGVTPIRAAHLAELRAAVAALESR